MFLCRMLTQSDPPKWRYGSVAHLHKAEVEGGEVPRAREVGGCPKRQGQGQSGQVPGVRCPVEYLDCDVWRVCLGVGRGRDPG